MVNRFWVNGYCKQVYVCKVNEFEIVWKYWEYVWSLFILIKIVF